MTSLVTTPTERPVFVATDGRRARRLRYAAVVTAVVAFAWVAALAIGMLGFGRLPGISLPVVARGPEKTAPQPVKPALRARDVKPNPQAVARTAKAMSRHDAASAARVQAASASTKPRAAAATRPRSGLRTSVRRRVTPTPRAQPSTAAPATPATPTSRQGWAKRGATAPPGETRRATAGAKDQQPAATPRGQARRPTAEETTTAPATTPVTTPAPPGQQKKADNTEEPS
jgi:hypothetical protein